MKKNTIGMIITALITIVCSVTVLAASAGLSEQKIIIGYVGDENVAEADDFMTSVEANTVVSGNRYIASNVKKNQLMRECLNLINSGVDVLIAAPGSDAIAAEMAIAAHANGIPFVVQSLGKTTADYDAIIGQTGYDGGSTAVACAIKMALKR